MKFIYFHNVTLSTQNAEVNKNLDKKISNYALVYCSTATLYIRARLPSAKINILFQRNIVTAEHLIAVNTNKFIYNCLNLNCHNYLDKARL